MLWHASCCPLPSLVVVLRISAKQWIQVARRFSASLPTCVKVAVLVPLSDDSYSVCFSAYLPTCENMSFEIGPLRGAMCFAASFRGKCFLRAILLGPYGISCRTHRVLEMACASGFEMRISSQSRARLFVANLSLEKGIDPSCGPALYSWIKLLGRLRRVHLDWHFRAPDDSTGPESGGKDLSPTLLGGGALDGKIKPTWRLSTISSLTGTSRT